MDATPTLRDSHRCSDKSDLTTTSQQNTTPQSDATKVETISLTWSTSNLKKLLNFSKDRKIDQLRIRFGTHKLGLEKIEQQTYEVDPPIEYLETFVDRDKILNNEWKKIITYGEEGLKIVKTNLVSFTSQEETIEYTSHTKVWTPTKSNDVVTFSVKRQSRIQASSSLCWKIIIDEVTFPDGDPHMVCSLVSLKVLQSADLEDVEQFMKHISAAPVRSKIIEYFFRYDIEFYEQLEQKNMIKDLEYEQRTSPAQMRTLYAKDDYYIIQQRFYGISREEYNKLPVLDWSEDGEIIIISNK